MKQYEVDGCGTGLILDPPDNRDVAFELDQVCSSVDSIPDEEGFENSDLTEHRIQYSTPTCVGFAWAHSVDLVESLANVPHSPPSVLGPHWWAREFGGTGNGNKVGGCRPRLFQMAVQKVGACDEEKWPFSEDDDRIIAKPDTVDVVMDRHKRSGGKYYFIVSTGVQRIVEIKATLSAPGKQKRPIQLAAAIGSSFVKAFRNGDEVAPFLQSGEAVAGYHMMCIDRYRMMQSGEIQLRIINSWPYQPYMWVPEESFHDDKTYTYIIYNGWKWLKRHLT